MQRSIERQEKSTEELNQRIKDKEGRRGADSVWNQREQIGSHERGLVCAKEMANARLDHPHDEPPDLSWYYGPGYFVDDVKGGPLIKERCIEARQLEVQYF